VTAEKECIRGSRDLFKFWEISGTISETVRDRYIVAIEDYYKIVCGLSDGTNTGDF